MLQTAWVSDRRIFHSNFVIGSLILLYRNHNMTLYVTRLLMTFVEHELMCCVNYMLIMRNAVILCDIHNGMAMMTYTARTFVSQLHKTHRK